MNALTGDRHRRLLQRLPGYLLRPLALFPGRLSQQGFVLLCNQVFAAPLARGELAFLDQRLVSIAIEDAGILLELTVTAGRIRAPVGGRSADATIRGSSYDLLLLASGREDPDTLFFQRRLRLEGDTELGLHLKNFLDAWEPPAGMAVFQRLADAYLRRAEP